ncbi:Rap guanine nucleotide exchange factor 1 [Acipenser ruthenus]|uniref:Rap guanine nucleotide exchange factor 1 n=1 Tax=Acipenser ruthenus TaxID=7906 RepID=A0A444V0D1_ACIRT|nr:Rap guanine nucleotide exchange factor 1 [Acipenser ruthenus]
MKSESANEEGGEGEYVNLYSSSQVNGELPHSRGDPAAVTDDALPDPSPQKPSTNSKENAEDGRRQKSTDSDHSDDEVDELSLIDHKEIMTRITLKQEVRDRVCASDQDLSAIIEHVEPSLRGLEEYCTLIDSSSSFRAYRAALAEVEPPCIPYLLVELTDDILKQLMDLVFRLVCSGELSLARVLRKNILDKIPEVLLWAKEQNEEKSPNLTQFTEHFNNMSYWVRSIIILQEKAQDREKLLLKFIKIMKYKSVYRSYSQDFAPHNQASIPPFLSPVSSHFTTVHQSQSLDLAAPATAGQSAVPGGVANGSQDSSGGSLAVCPPSEPSLPDSLQTSVDPAAVTDDALPDPSPQKPSTNSKENAEDGRRQKSTDSDHSDEEVDELSLIDHKEIMTRITLKQEVRDRVCASDQDLSAIIEHVEPSLRSDDGPDVRAGSGDILLVHATETDRKVGVSSSFYSSFFHL